MSLRWTRSRDDRVRATITIRYRVDRVDLVLAAADLAMEYAADLSTVEPSRARVENRLRNLLRSNGDTLQYHGEKFVQSEWEPALAEGERVVSALWPELDGERS